MATDIRSPQTRSPLELGFVLLPSFTLTPFAALLDVFRLAADKGDRSQPQRLHWQLLATSLEPVEASCGARLAPWGELGDPRRFDYVIVCGGLLSRDRRGDEALHAFLQTAARHDVPIIGLCTAVFDLAAAGLLDGRRACVSWFHAQDFAERFDSVRVDASQLYVEDGRIITCSGGTGAADVGALVVQRHFGTGVARKALDILLIDQPRGATAPQPACTDKEVADPLVQRALLIFEQEMEAALSVNGIARRLGSSRRTLERRFRQATGLSPLAFLAQARIERADWLVRTTALPLTAIAARCGFADSAHFSRRFREAYGLTPSSARRPGGTLLHGESRPYPLT